VTGPAIGGLRRFVPTARPDPAPARQPGQAPGQPPARAAALSSIRPGIQPAQDPTAARSETCEFCAEEVPVSHGHVADLERSSLMCACRACYLLFTHDQAGLPGPSAGRGRYRAIPDRYRTDPDHPVSGADWDRLEIPVGLAFFLRSSARDTVIGFYPSPAGVTECRLDLGTWHDLAATHPILAAAEPDVEAVLITRGGSGSTGTGSDSADVECFIVPIDACYELAGLMRLHWHGFDGGTEARNHIAEFLGRVRSRASALAKGQ
jgi:hypothetical protein